MIKLPEEIDLENYTLILPSVSIGNVGQLCIDLLISNLNLCKVGSFWSSMFIPVCGLDPYDESSNSICTNADFYLGTTHKIIVLQLRSPCIGKSIIFFDELTQFVRQRKINKVIILTSSYDHERTNRSDSNLRYITSDDLLINNENLLKKLRWERHVKEMLMRFVDSTELTENYDIHGGGFANSLYDYLESMKIPCTVLFCYCSGGHNVSDALILFKSLNQWMNFIETNTNDDIDIKYPPSWINFFSVPPASELY